MELVGLETLAAELRRFGWTAEVETPPASAQVTATHPRYPAPVEIVVHTVEGAASFSFPGRRNRTIAPVDDPARAVRVVNHVAGVPHQPGARHAVGIGAGP